MDKYSEVEQEAIKWLSETDTMQFSTMELLAMFAEHWKVKSSLVDVRQQGELLVDFRNKIIDWHYADFVPDEAIKYYIDLYIKIRQ